MSNATRTGHAPTGPAPPSIPDTPTDPSRAVARPRPGRSLPRLRAQPHGPPAQARPRTQREGRGLPRPEDRHGGAPINEVNATRPFPSTSARSTAHERPYIVILGDGQQVSSTNSTTRR